MLSIKPCLHTVHSFQSIIEATEKFPGVGHLITWNGPIMGHLNSFLALGGGDLNKNANAGGGLPGGGMFKLRFDWYSSSNWSSSHEVFYRCVIPCIV